MTTETINHSVSGFRILRLYHFYRLSLGLVLVLLISSNLLEVMNYQLFYGLSWLYLLLNAVITVFVPKPARATQLLSLALVDIIFLATMLYAAGGTPSGIGNLIVMAVAISNMLLRGRIGILIAAIAAIAMLFSTVYLDLNHRPQSTQYFHAGALGALCFLVALLIQSITQRMSRSENLAQQRADDVANLEELNTQIIQRMRTGILVIDPLHRVLSANNAATELLGRGELSGRIIDPLCPELLTRVKNWQQNPTLRPANLQAQPSGPMLQPSFISLQRGNAQHTLIFLEDISHIAQQAQQLKLVALGRLTAGIAHEIRNPLGAISHAAQLLQESEELSIPDQRLAQIIQDQSKRMNQVIENVLQLSRRRQAEPQLLDLKYWVHRFASEFSALPNPSRQLHVQTDGGSLQTRIDPQQLVQVLTNLVQNGLRYSAQKNTIGQVWLHLYRDEARDLPVLDVIDDGDGVAKDQEHAIFEPFFTTDSKGTGLGLYISREICEGNQAHLDYLRHESGGSCFRITFAHPRKLS